MDFWCTVAVVQVQYCNDVVIWEKFGLVTGKINVQQWVESGIDGWDDWKEEEMIRLWNYFYPHFNDDSNIHWLDCERLAFSAKEYELCVNTFRENNYQRIRILLRAEKFVKVIKSLIEDEEELYRIIHEEGDEIEWDQVRKIYFKH